MAKLTLKKTKYKNPQHGVFSSPGTLRYFGKNITENISIKHVTFNSEELRIDKNISLSSISKHLESKMINWFEVSGFHQTDIIEKVGQKFNLHPLLLEDTLNTTQKPKLEYFEDENQTFLILKVPRFVENSTEVEFEHIALIYHPDFVLSFQEMDHTDVFEPMLSRLERPNSKTRKKGTDFLFYALIDIIIDSYYLVLNHLESKIDELETEILRHAKPHHQNQLFFLKRETSYIKKSLFPLKEILNLLIRDENNKINSEVKKYFRDALDHVLENLETLDGCKDDIENLLVNYHSQLSNNMNSVMKTLTVFTAIFMPLTFIVGIYGMNFENMPELKQPNGYFYTLGAMTLMSISLWIYFKWKKYL